MISKGRVLRKGILFFTPSLWLLRMHQKWLSVAFLSCNRYIQIKEWDKIVFWLCIHNSLQLIYVNSFRTDQDQNGHHFICYSFVMEMISDFRNSKWILFSDTRTLDIFTWVFLIFALVDSKLCSAWSRVMSWSWQHQWVLSLVTCPNKPTKPWSICLGGVNISGNGKNSSDLFSSTIIISAHGF